MDTYQKHPLKIYVQDIYRAKRSETNKYIYELFGLTFKNIMIHGVVTSIYNKKHGSSANIELTDATGSVQIYYNYSKAGLRIGESLRKIDRESRTVFMCSSKGPILKQLFASISDNCKNPVDFKKGDYVCVVGDLFLDDLKDTRMISAYQCKLSTCEREVIWLEELQYLYDKYYLWKHV